MFHSKILINFDGNNTLALQLMNIFISDHTLRWCKQYSSIHSVVNYMNPTLNTPYVYTLFCTTQVPKAIMTKQFPTFGIEKSPLVSQKNYGSRKLGWKQKIVVLVQGCVCIHKACVHIFRAHAFVGGKSYYHPLLINK